MRKKKNNKIKWNKTKKSLNKTKLKVGVEICMVLLLLLLLPLHISNNQTFVAKWQKRSKGEEKKCGKRRMKTKWKNWKKLKISLVIKLKANNTLSPTLSTFQLCNTKEASFFATVVVAISVRVQPTMCSMTKVWLLSMWSL